MRWTIRLGLLLLVASGLGCTSQDVFHDTNWKTLCDIDANAAGCDSGADGRDSSKGAEVDRGRGRDAGSDSSDARGEG